MHAHATRVLVFHKEGRVSITSRGGENSSRESGTALTGMTSLRNWNEGLVE